MRMCHAWTANYGICQLPWKAGLNGVISVLSSRMRPHTVRRIGAALSPRNGFGYASFLAFLHLRNFGRQCSSIYSWWLATAQKEQRKAQTFCESSMCELFGLRTYAMWAGLGESIGAMQCIWRYFQGCSFDSWWREERASFFQEYFWRCCPGKSAYCYPSLHTRFFSQWISGWMNLTVCSQCLV